MRFTLGDLLIATVSVVILKLSITPFVKDFIPFHNLSSLVGSLFLSVFVTSFFYRFFHLAPLLLPRCPKCKDANRHYWTLHRKWPRELLQCSNCDSQVELLFEKRGTNHEQQDRTYFLLLWPYSLGGRWQCLSSQKKKGQIEPEKS